jgi:phage FluMu protein Com
MLRGFLNMDYFKTCCTNCKNTLFLNKEKFPDGKAIINVKCPNCSIVFQFKIPENEDFIEASNKKQVIIEKGNEKLNNFLKNETVKKISKIVVAIAAGFIVFIGISIIGVKFFGSFNYVKFVAVIFGYAAYLAVKRV